LAISYLGDPELSTLKTSADVCSSVLQFFKEREAMTSLSTFAAGDGPPFWGSAVPVVSRGVFTISTRSRESSGLKPRGGEVW